jgi:hypothetical protein
MISLLLSLSALGAPLDTRPAVAAVSATAPHGWQVRAGAAVRFGGGGRVRLDAERDGVPLRGERPVARVDAHGGVRRVHGALPAVVGPTEPVVSEAAAARASRLALTPWGEVAHVGPPAAVWWAVDGEARLHWAVSARTQGEVPHTWEVLIDASTGEPTTVRRTSATAEALIYDPHPVASDVSRVRLAAPDLLGPYADARSCEEVGDGSVISLGTCGAWARQAQPDEDGDYLFRPKPGEVRDPFAEVQAWVHADRMLAWLHERYDLQLPYGPIDTFVNFELANAFFGDFDDDGAPDISFGHEPTTGTDLAYDADVVYHELGHAVVGHLAPDLPFLQADELGMDWVSGSINEGTADIFAMVLTGDPDVGEYAGSAFGRDAIRALAAPRTCPAGLEGEVHRDGEVLGSWAWSLIEHPEVGPEAMADLMMGAIPLWGAVVTWSHVGDTLAWSADDLAAEGVLSAEGREAVDAALLAHGLVDCERVHTLGFDQSRSFYLLSAGLEPPFDHIPSAAQVRIDVPAGAEQLIIEEEALSAAPGLGWAVVGRVGEPVSHSQLSLAGVAIASPDTYDWIVDVDDGRVVLGTDGDAPLQPGQPLFLSITGRAVGDLETLAFAQGLVRFVVTEPPRLPEPSPAPAAAPPPPTEHLGMACGCATPSPWSLAPSLFAGLLLFRRRGTGPAPR